MTKRIVVLISGSGSNLQAVMDAIDAGQINGRIEAVLSNKAEAFGLERATKAGIPALILKHTDFESRESFDQAMIEKIDQHKPDLIVLAGFMRILSAEFVRHYQGRMFNIHPSLLPKYKGLHTHQRAIEAGDSEHGCTVHFVTEELDGGPLAVQGKVSIDGDDNAESLQQKVHKVEHQIYPLAVEWFCADRLKWTKDGVELDGKQLPSQGYQQEK
ncbi:phosphoribosylglycinamide formyltransferase [Neptuniibacter caesariensis]|uniref:Phosphoribosylglycinamide formyltransferase n=1 Tax=Neptuniibacter caesariensis TaxID=207954 RepID=A0A7U8GR16_NEPCE|nr:phosphoribosylglycinamide formyltransferase [Neptuniibacter caesariensis]EAR59743.1 phosphoribosylglycinamide formyltransferase [Oceanospirillum sp. MED92] [Neptuniibacter caesariensis]